MTGVMRPLKNFQVGLRARSLTRGTCVFTACMTGLGEEARASSKTREEAVVEASGVATRISSKMSS